MRHKSFSLYRFVCIVLVIVMLALMSAVCVQATESKCELDILYQHDGEPITDVSASAYYIGSFDNNGDITLAGNFAHYSVDTSTDNLSALAQTLYGYVLLDKITPEHTAVSDDTGAVVMTDMDKGVYLVTSKRLVKEDEVFITEPQLIFLPWKEDEEWLYRRTMLAKCRMIMMNDTPISAKVLKVWDDENYENLRPTSIKATLLRDDEVYDTVELSADNNWRHTWEFLPSYYIWTVVEEIPQGYEVIQTQEGITRVLTNSYDTTPSPTTPTEPTSNPTTQTEPATTQETTENTTSPETTEKLPQTGQLWWPVPILFVLGVVLITVGIKKRKGE